MFYFMLMDAEEHFINHFIPRRNVQNPFSCLRLGISWIPFRSLDSNWRKEWPRKVRLSLQTFSVITQSYLYVASFWLYNIFRSGQAESTREGLLPISFPLLWAWVYPDLLDPSPLWLQRRTARKDAAVYRVAHGLFPGRSGPQGAGWQRKATCSHSNGIISIQQQTRSALHGKLWYFRDWEWSYRVSSS